MIQFSEKEDNIKIIKKIATVNYGYFFIQLYYFIEKLFF
jgi:hypothetical protein